MDIVSALATIVTLEESLTITSPVAMTIKTAYQFPPDRAVALPDTPCFVNSFDLTEVDWYIGPGQTPEQKFTVNIQLFVKDASVNQAASIAASFLAPLIAALNANPTLSGAVSLVTMRGGSPTLCTLEWSGLSYQGLNVFLDLTMYN